MTEQGCHEQLASHRGGVPKNACQPALNMIFETRFTILFVNKATGRKASYCIRSGKRLGVLLVLAAAKRELRRLTTIITHTV